MIPVCHCVSVALYRSVTVCCNVVPCGAVCPCQLSADNSCLSACQHVCVCICISINVYIYIYIYIYMWVYIHIYRYIDTSTWCSHTHIWWMQGGNLANNTVSQEQIKMLIAQLNSNQMNPGKVSYVHVRTLYIHIYMYTYVYISIYIYIYIYVYIYIHF